MLPFPRTQFLSLAVAGALVALTASSTPIRADELVQNLGPVGPYEPILTLAGSKRVIAFYEPDKGNCAVNIVVWNNTRADYIIAKFWPDTVYSAARVRINLDPGETAEIDGDEDKGLKLECGDNAAALMVVRG
jgi:hypothetical protein